MPLKVGSIWFLYGKFGATYWADVTFKGSLQWEAFYYMSDWKKNHYISNSINTVSINILSTSQPI